MKKFGLFVLFIFAFFLLAPVWAVDSQPIGMNTPALAQPQIDILAELGKALLIALGSLLGYVLKQCLPLINVWIKQIMHFRGSSVIADSLTQSVAEMGVEVQKALADGKITEEEKKAIKKRAKEISSSKLKSLSGFYKKDLMGWVDEVMEVELGKLLARIFT